MTLGQRIRLARKRANLSQEKVGEALGVTRNSVSMWESDQTKPESDRLGALAATLECPAGWLIVGDEFGQLQDEPNAQLVSAPAVPRRQVPLVSRVPGGPESEASDPYAVGAAENWLTPTEQLSVNSFALRVVGHSMEPDFPDGCVIFVDPAVAWRSGDFVVVRFEGSSEATFKRIVRDGDDILLVALNPQYPTRKLDSEFTVVGVVREMRRLIR